MLLGFFFRVDGAVLRLLAMGAVGVKNELSVVDNEGVKAANDVL